MSRGGCLPPESSWNRWLACLPRQSP
eukprot:gene27048-biopygen17614